MQQSGRDTTGVGVPGGISRAGGVFEPDADDLQSEAGFGAKTVYDRSTSEEQEWHLHVAYALESLRLRHIGQGGVMLVRAVTA